MDPESTCTERGCNAPIWWGVTEAYRRMPVDPEPSPDGNVVRVARRDGKILLRVLSGDELPWLGDVTPEVGPYVPHHRTCTNADRFRGTPGAGPGRCRVCRGPLRRSVTIPVRPGEPPFDTHPCCDPAPGADRARAALTAARTRQQTLELEGA